MQMTHEQAHQLIQLSMDQALSSQEKKILSAHLQGCTDCQTYANEINEVEHLLSPMMKRQWGRQPAPLSLRGLIERNQKIQTSALVTTRNTAIGLIVLTLFFSVWQFVITGSPTSGQLPVIVPPVPTPFALTAPSTNTTVSFENCKMMKYVVGANDTLAGIAEQFSIPEDYIVAINSLSTKPVRPSRELIIPVCNFTPTGTVPATFTTTYTPIVRPITLTPGG